MGGAENRDAERACAAEETGGVPTGAPCAGRGLGAPADAGSAAVSAGTSADAPAAIGDAPTAAREVACEPGSFGSKAAPASVFPAPRGKKPAFGWFLALGAALVALICGVAGVASVLATAVGLDVETVAFHSLVPGDPLFKRMAAGLVCGLIYLAACCFVARHAERINEKRFTLVLAALASALCVWWVVVSGTEYNGFSDSKQVLLYAQQLAAGDYSSFLPHSKHFLGKLVGDMYLSNYPFQSGIVLLLEGFVRVFDDHAVMAFQLANAVAAVSAALTLVRMARICERPKPERLLVALIALTFVPPLLFVTFPYGNAIGFALALLAIELWMRSRGTEGAKRYVLLAVAFVVLALGLMAKSTYLVVAIGALIVLLIDCLRKRDGISAVVLVASLVLANSVAGALPVRVMEARLGYELPENQPKTAWIAMGLSNDNAFGGEMPGWWGESALLSQIYSDGDVEVQEADAMESIQGSLKQFASDPGYACWFFGKKLASEWLDPTFQSIYIARIGIMTPEAAAHGTNEENRSFCPMDTSFFHGKVVRVLYMVMEGEQSLIYLGAAGGAACLFIDARRRRGNVLDYLLPCAFFMGFFVYVLWEAKGMYCMPFFFCLIPVAARGVAAFAEKANKRLPEHLAGKARLRR